MWMKKILSLTDGILKQSWADVEMFMTASVFFDNRGSTEHWRSPEQKHKHYIMICLGYNIYSNMYIIMWLGVYGGVGSLS